MLSVLSTYRRLAFGVYRTPILHRLGQVRHIDGIRIGQIRNGAGYFKRAVGAAG